MTDVQFLDEALTAAYEESARGKLVESGILVKLVPYLSDDTYSVNALEVLFLLSLHAPNQKTMATTEGLANSVKKLMTRGRLKQKKVAMATFKNIQPFVATEDSPSSPSRAGLSEITNLESSVTGFDSMFKPHQPRGKAFVTRGSTCETSKKGTVAESATSFSLFVENLNTPDAQRKIESCLLQTPGVVSFFCDAAEEKVVIRTTASRDQLIESIFNSTNHRASLIKGQYSDFRPGGYLDNVPPETDEGWGSYLWQIISVGQKSSSFSKKNSHQEEAQTTSQSWFWW